MLITKHWKIGKLVLDEASFVVKSVSLNQCVLYMSQHIISCIFIFVSKLNPKYVIIGWQRWLTLLCERDSHHMGTHILHWRIEEVVNYAQANEGNTVLMFEISIAHESTAFPSLPLHCTNYKILSRGKGNLNVLLEPPTQTRQFTIIFISQRGKETSVTWLKWL